MKEQKKILVFGSGGAAKAVILSLTKKFTKSEFIFYNRNINKIKNLVNNSGNRTKAPIFEAFDFEEYKTKAIKTIPTAVSLFIIHGAITIKHESNCFMLNIYDFRTLNLILGDGPVR